MKTIKQLAVAAVAMALIGTASAGPGHNGNYVGPVPSVGSVYYRAPHGHYAGGYYAGGNVWVPFAVGVITGVVVNEARRQPEVVYIPTPAPRVVYVPSDPRLPCDGGQVINGGYYCPRLVP